MRGITIRPSISMGSLELVTEYLANSDGFEPELTGVKSLLQREIRHDLVTSKKQKTKATADRIMKKFSLLPESDTSFDLDTSEDIDFGDDDFDFDKKKVSSEKNYIENISPIIVNKGFDESEEVGTDSKADYFEDDKDFEEENEECFEDSESELDDLFEGADDAEEDDAEEDDAEEDDADALDDLLDDDSFDSDDESHLDLDELIGEDEEENDSDDDNDGDNDAGYIEDESEETDDEGIDTWEEDDEDEIDDLDTLIGDDDEEEEQLDDLLGDSEEDSTGEIYEPENELEGSYEEGEDNYDEADYSEDELEDLLGDDESEADELDDLLDDEEDEEDADEDEHELFDDSDEDEAEEPEYDNSELFGDSDESDSDDLDAILKDVDDSDEGEEDSLDDLLDDEESEADEGESNKVPHSNLSHETSPIRQAPTNNRAEHARKDVEQQAVRNSSVVQERKVVNNNAPKTNTTLGQQRNIATASNTNKGAPVSKGSNNLKAGGRVSNSQNVGTRSQSEKPDYSEMSMDKLKACMNQFLACHGVSRAPVSLRLVNEEFGVANVKKLAQKNIIIIMGKGVTKGL